MRILIKGAIRFNKAIVNQTKSCSHKNQTLLVKITTKISMVYMIQFNNGITGLGEQFNAEKHYIKNASYITENHLCLTRIFKIA